MVQQKCANPVSSRDSVEESRALVCSVKSAQQKQNEERVKCHKESIASEMRSLTPMPIVLPRLHALRKRASDDSAVESTLLVLPLEGSFPVKVENPVRTLSADGLTEPKLHQVDNNCPFTTSEGSSIYATENDLAPSPIDEGSSATHFVESGQGPVVTPKISEKEFLTQGTTVKQEVGQLVSFEKEEHKKKKNAQSSPEHHDLEDMVGSEKGNSKTPVRNIAVSHPTPPRKGVKTDADSKKPVSKGVSAALGKTAAGSKVVRNPPGGQTKVVKSIHGNAVTAAENAPKADETRIQKTAASGLPLEVSQGPGIAPSVRTAVAKSASAAAELQRRPPVPGEQPFPLRHVSLGRKEFLGKGSYGIVYKALDIDTNCIVAVKEISLLSTSAEQLPLLRREISLLQRLNHPCIVRCYGHDFDEHYIRVYLEYMPGGSVKSLLTNFGPFQERQASLLTRQVLEGLQFLHDRRIAHRDVKGDNLLLDTMGHLRLADFGVAKELAAPTMSVTGTAYFMAPEVIKGIGYGLPADIWSVGCCVVEMVTGKPPFASISDQYAVMMHITELGSTEDLLREVVPSGCSPQLCSFLTFCFQRDPAMRPTCAQLLKHEWIVCLPENKIKESVVDLAPPINVQSVPQLNQNAFPVVASTKSLLECSRLTGTDGDFNPLHDADVDELTTNGEPKDIQDNQPYEVT